MKSISTPRELPLAAAQRRLGKPGRPRTRPAADPDAVGGVRRAQGGDSGRLFERGRPGGDDHLQPRLLSQAATAAYLGVGETTIKALRDAGTLRPVPIPLGHTVVRKILYDRTHLDALVDAWSHT